MLEDHLPVLAIVVPLIAAPLCFLFLGTVSARPLAWVIAVGAIAFSFVASVQLVQMVYDGGVLSYRLGNYAPPFGIEFRIDGASALVLLVIAASALAVILFARKSIALTLPPSRVPYFYICFLLAFGGLMGVVATGDAFNMFVFLEISSLATYTLIALGGAGDRRAFSAAFNYLVLGTIGATFFVLGIGFLYAATGTLNMADLASKLPILSGNSAVQAAFALIFTGLALKIAIFPLHFWLPNAYAFAPNAVTAFLSASATKAAIYALLRFMFTVFGVEFSFGGLTIDYLLLPLAVMGMFIASAVAIFQNDLRRLLAWSSVAQISFMLLALSLATQSGLSATFIHIFNHALMKATLFMAIGCVALRQNSYSFSVLEGLGRKQPFTAILILIGGAALVGVPLTSGFISKWILLEAVMEKELLWLAFLVVAASLLTAIYVGKMVQTMFFASVAGGGERLDAPASMLLPAFVLAAATLFFGVNPELPLALADRAATALLNPNPASILVLPR